MIDWLIRMLEIFTCSFRYPWFQIRCHIICERISFRNWSENKLPCVLITWKTAKNFSKTFLINKSESFFWQKVENLQPYMLIHHTLTAFEKIWFLALHIFDIQLKLLDWFRISSFFSEKGHPTSYSPSKRLPWKILFVFLR